MAGGESQGEEEGLDTRQGTACCKSWWRRELTGDTDGAVLEDLRRRDRGGQVGRIIVSSSTASRSRGGADGLACRLNYLLTSSQGSSPEEPPRVMTLFEVIRTLKFIEADDRIVRSALPLSQNHAEARGGTAWPHCGLLFHLRACCSSVQPRIGPARGDSGRAARSPENEAGEDGDRTGWLEKCGVDRYVPQSRAIPVRLR